MKTIEDLISTEPMGGWPIYRMNLREILLALGLKNDGTYLKIQINNPILDIYPIRLTDDGMAYGVDQEWIHEIDVNTKEKYINIWTEKEFSEKRLERVKKDYLELEELIKKKTNEISR